VENGELQLIKLTQVTIDKYKSIQKPQTIQIDPSITTIVGMNEAGKTSFLTALAKMNLDLANKMDKHPLIRLN